MRFLRLREFMIKLLFEVKTSLKQMNFVTIQVALFFDKKFVSFFIHLIYEWSYSKILKT